MADHPSALKGSCSEFLGLFGLLRHWIAVEAPDDEDLDPKKRSFNKLCSVIDLILQVKRGSVLAASAVERLAAYSTQFMVLHKVVWVHCKFGLLV
jgi:hypothetical protein